MRIAIPVESDSLAQEFSRASAFALYDVHDDTRAVTYLGRQEVAEPGCGKTPPILKSRQVEVVLGHRVSQNAVAHLLESKIVAIQDAPLLTPDALIAHLVTGTLQATAPHVEGAESGCGSAHGCGHCSSHAHADHDHDHAAPESQHGGCSSHGGCAGSSQEPAAHSCSSHQSQSCCGGASAQN